MLKGIGLVPAVFGKKTRSCTNQVGKYQQRANKINNQMDGVESQIQVVMAKNKGCKKTLELLKTAYCGHTKEERGC